MPSVSLALFPGSFDPFHLGHLAIVEWAASTHDAVVVAVLGNPEKPAGMFTRDERVRLAGLATAHLPNVVCLAFHGTTGRLAQEQHADVIIRSAHKEADLERSLAVLNKFMSGGVPTEFAPADPATETISSTLVRELLTSGEVDAALALVPAAIHADLPTAGRVEPAGPRVPGEAGAPARSGPGPMTLGRRVRPVRVAAVSATPVLLDRDATLDRALTLVEEAAATGAQLVVLPQAFLPGYPDWVWRTRPWDADATRLAALLFDNAVVVGSAVTQVLGQAAKRYGIHLSVGIDEREATGATVYATQLLYEPGGELVSVHRSLAPAGGERLVWGAGDGSALRVVETPFGRIGTLIGREAYLPLARAALQRQGMDILLVPTWASDDVWPATIRHVAREGSAVAVSASTSMRASDLPAGLPGRDTLYADADEWLSRGDTMIVGPRGDVLAGAHSGEAGIVTADVDLNDARHLRQRFDSSRGAGADVFRLQVGPAEPDRPGPVPPAPRRRRPGPPSG